MQNEMIPLPQSAEAAATPPVCAQVKPNSQRVMGTSANSLDGGRLGGSREGHLRNFIGLNNHQGGSSLQQREARFWNGSHQRKREHKKPLNSKQDQGAIREVANRAHKGQDLEFSTIQGQQDGQSSSRKEQVRWQSASPSSSFPSPLNLRHDREQQQEQLIAASKCQMLVRPLTKDSKGSYDCGSDSRAHGVISPSSKGGKHSIDSYSKATTRQPFKEGRTNPKRSEHKFRNVVQETIRRNRNSSKNCKYKAAATGRRSAPSATRSDTCENSERLEPQQKLERWKEEDGQFEEAATARSSRSPPSSRRESSGCCAGGQQQNSEKFRESGKEATATYFKEDFRGKNVVRRTELASNNSLTEASSDCQDDYDARSSCADLSDIENLSKNAAQGSLPSASSSQGAKKLSIETMMISEGIEALGSDVKSHLIACATAAITANFMAQNNGFRNSARGYSNCAYKRQEQAPLYQPPSSNLYQVDGEKSDVNSADQNHSLHLSMDKLKTLVERNLVATLVCVYILVSLAVILALTLPYLSNPPHGQDANDVVPPIGLLNDALERAQKQLADIERRDTFDRLSPDTYHHQQQQHEHQHQQQSSSVASLHSDKRVVRTGETDDTQRLHTTVSQPYSDEDLTKKQLVAKHEPVKQNEKRADHTVDSKISNTAITDNTNETINYEEKKEKEKKFMVGLRAKYGDLWKIEHNESCQPIQSTFCSRSLESMFTKDFTSPTQQHLTPNLPASPRLYESTLLPNQFSRASQSEVENILDEFEPVVGVKCFALMRLFLCSNFVPKCITVSSKASSIDQQGTGAMPSNFTSSFKGTSSAMKLDGPAGIGKRLLQHNRSRLVPPCKSLCKEAFRKCLFFFEVLSIKLIDPEDCEALPDSLDPNVCIGKQELEWLVKATEQASCPADKFRCSSGECISKAWRCDGFADCFDKSDEINCSRCNAATQFYCGHGGLVGSPNNQDACISKDQVCDGVKSCKDGRDERQCLRLSQVINPQKNNNAHSAPRQLEVWSAVHDLWLPVCGAHWSALPMSHEACQALGYSRANQTLYLFGPLTPPAAATNTTSALSRLVSPGSTRSSAAGPNLSKTSLDNLPTYQGRIGTWSGLSRKRIDESGSWAEIIEDMDGTVERPVNKRNHDIVYGRQIGMPVKDGIVSFRINPDLVSIDAGEAKFKSLTSMLYHGSLSGCLDKPIHMMSTVNLVCENFQCGRSITSYSTRLRSTQHYRMETAYTTVSSPRRYGGRVWAPRSSASVAQSINIDDVTSAPENDITLNMTRRVRTLESFDDLDAEGVDETANLYENDNDGEDLLMMDKVAKEQLQKSSNDQPISSRLVVGGIESMPGEFPYLAALHGGPDEVFFCGGVLISVNWLLTAAHCVGNRTQPDGWMIKVGVTRRIASPTFVKKLKVSKIIKHQDFDKGMEYNNDIALILLEESVDFNQYLRPICLPRANLKLGPDNSRDCVVVGFGKSKFSQDANYLQVAHFANVPIVHNEQCAIWYQEHNVSLSDGMLCAGWAEGKRDACQGDSGSGLFCRYSSTNQFFVAGVVSFGIKCATPKLPGVYTSVPKYVDWIESTTRKNGYPLV